MAQIEIPAAYQTVKTQLQTLVARWHYTKSEVDTKVSAKADIEDVIVDMELVPKNTDNSGAIRLIYGNDGND